MLCHRRCGLAYLRTYCLTRVRYLCGMTINHITLYTKSNDTNSLFSSPIISPLLSVCIAPNASQAQVRFQQADGSCFLAPTQTGGDGNHLLPRIILMETNHPGETDSKIGLVHISTLGKTGLI